MKKMELMTCLLGFMFTSGIWAQPFQVTTISNQQFAPDTHWYTMRIGSSQKYISDNAGASFISLQPTADYGDAYLWCFTGDATNGYSLYNKQAGPDKLLASSTSMNTLSGYSGTGGSTYPTLQAATELPSGYVGTWDLSQSTNLADVDGYYLMLHGTSYAVNDFANLGKLAFWAEGKDAGSTVSFELAMLSTEINMENGSFTASNSDKSWHSVWSSNIVGGLTLSTSANNMTSENGFVSGASGRDFSSTYTLTAPEGFVIAGYSFDFVNNASSNGTETLTIEGTTYQSSHTEQHVSVDGLTENTASFTQTGNNDAVTFKNFTVTLKKSVTPPEPQQDLFVTQPGNKPYRIPAIATAPNGDIFAISDYRPCGSDIGYGEVDIKCRISKDNGATWGEEFFVADGLGETAAGSDTWKIGFGDAAVVADRERNELLIMSVCGKVVCWNGNYIPDSPASNPNPVARTRASINETTGEWEFTQPEEVTESIYRLFVDENHKATVQSLFIGSGRIAQSRIVKVKDYYRLYCAMWTKNEGNRVIYSDDFGETWNILGSIDDRPATGGDEPKCEELPDGSVLLSSRVGGGRIFNIYTFTDRTTGEGYWSSAVTSNSSTSGVAIGGNSTNGEVMLVPAKRKADQKQVYLLLQSVPFGATRAQVGIYYKELESLNDFSSPLAVASNWDGSHKSTTLGSAYSTMTWQKDNTLGFLYEESTYGADYTIVYKNYTIEQITDDNYEYDSSVTVDGILLSGIDQKAEGLESGTMVGQPKDNAVDDVQQAIATFKENPTQENYDAVNTAIYNMPRVELSTRGIYRLRNVNRSQGTLYMVPEVNTEKNHYTTAVSNLTNANQLFRFVQATTTGTYYLQSCNYETYLGPLGANETEPVITSNPAEAGIWMVKSHTDGKSQMICQNNTGNHKGLHLAGDNARLVPWTVDADASLWYIEPVTTFDVKVNVAPYLEGFCYPFNFRIPEDRNVYAATGLVWCDDMVCVNLTHTPTNCIPSKMPVLIGHAEEKGTVTVEVVEEAEWTTEDVLGTDTEYGLKGTLAETTVSDSHVYLLSSDFIYTTSKAIGPNRVYYATDKIWGPKLPWVVNRGTPVGIEHLTTTQEAKCLYNLHGLRVKNPVHGIFITDQGEKVFAR